MELRSNCPFCDPPDTNGHLYYNTQKQSWFCFRCGRGGRGPNPAGETGHREHKGFPEIKLSPNSQLLHDIFLRNSQSMTARAARSYLEKHHLEADRVAFEQRLLIDNDYLVFPVYRKDQLIYFQKRHLFSKSFLNPDVETKPLFWTDDLCRDGRTVIVESYINALRIDRWVTGCAIFGKFLGDEGAEEIASKAEHVDILLDAGESEAALKISRKLKHYGVPKVRVKRIVAPTGTDVCNLDDSRCRVLLRSVG